LAINSYSQTDFEKGSVWGKQEKQHGITHFLWVPYELYLTKWQLKSRSKG